MKTKIKKCCWNIFNFFENNYYFSSIKSSLVILLPLIIIGAFALIIRNIPVDWYLKFIETFMHGTISNFFDFFIEGIFGHFAVYLVLTISYFGIKGKTKNLAVILTTICTSFVCLWIVSNKDLSTKNMSTAIFFGTLTPFFISKCLNFVQLKKKIYGKSYFQFYMDALKILIPAFIMLLGAYMINLFAQNILCVPSIIDGFSLFFKTMITKIGPNLGSGLLCIFFICLLWFLGFDGTSIMKSSVLYLDNNNAIINQSFIYTYVFIGGLGVGLALLLCMVIFTKKKSHRIISTVEVIPNFFNSCHITVMGFPIILNPVFFIPFIFSPIIAALVAYIGIEAGFVPEITRNISWSTPFIISGIEVTHGIKGLVIQLIIVVLSFGLYTPFIILHNKAMERSFNENIRTLYPKFLVAKEINPSNTIFDFNYNLGNVARKLLILLKKDIKEQKIEMYFQPLVNKERKIVGMESLLRWFYKGFYVSPPLVLEIAHEGGIYDELNNYIWERICQEVKDKPTRHFITFNVGVESLEKPTFSQDMINLFAKYNLDPKRFIIEITEESVLNHQLEVFETINNLKEVGFRFAIDDFGAGQTSLKYFQTNAFDLVKFDGELVKEAEKNPQNYDIIKSIKDLGRKKAFENINNFKVLCEYVETEEQFNKLKNLKIDYYQGWLFYKAIPYSEVLEAIKKEKMIKETSEE